jgi:hypothetical protein
MHGGLMKKSSAASAFKSPLFIALGVMAVVVFGLSFVQYARRGGFWSPEVEARVFTTGKGTRDGGGANNGERRFALQGEVYSDAERLREASAVALGGMLIAAERQLNSSAIESVDGLIEEMYRAEAVPPAVQFDSARKCFTSEAANYYLRYRQSPLGVEVVSECKGQLCGPALLVRLPDDEFSQGALTYYTAPQRGNVPVPAAFSSAGDVIKAGWRPEKFRAQVPQLSN